MTDVVIFSDTSLQDSDYHATGDIIFELPTKSAGPYRIASEARKHGYTCQVVNLCFYFSEDEIERLCEKFITKDTLVVGLSTTFWFHAPDNRDRRVGIIKRILNYTKRFSNAKLVIGGTMSGTYSEKVKADKSFDGFSEDSFVEYLKTLKAPTIQAEGFDFNKSMITYTPNDCVDFGESKVMEVARGCIFKCSFCAYPLNGKKKLDYIKYSDVLEAELLHNYENYGITTYTLSDDTFNDSTEKLISLHKVFTSLPFKIKFVTYLRLDLLNAHREQIDILKEMGLAGAFFGVETFNHNAGKYIGKGLQPDKSKALLYDLKATHWKDDVNITIGLISGLPFETQQTHRETVDWIKNPAECNIDRVRSGPLSVLNPLLNKYTYNSEFQDNALKYGFYWPNPQSHDWKNLSHEIKTYAMARDMSNEIYAAAKDSKKHMKGNFGLPLYANLAKYDTNPKSFLDLLHMDSATFITWAETNRKAMSQKYIENYKKTILSI